MAKVKKVNIAVAYYPHDTATCEIDITKVYFKIILFLEIMKINYFRLII
jgi:hypothetical protein